MSSWDSRLAQLEDLLQTLIEGSADRLFRGEVQKDLAARLMTAMESGIQSQTEAEFLVPNLYFLKANPADASLLLENQAVLQELADIIHRAGLQAGLHFPAAPVIKVTADPDLPPGRTKIEARLTPPEIGRTKTLVEAPSAPAIP